MAIAEANPLFDQSVEVGSVHEVETERVYRVVSLLVGNDEDNIRALVNHGFLNGVIFYSVCCE
jgi:hypothetical protein